MFTHVCVCVCMYCRWMAIRLCRWKIYGECGPEDYGLRRICCIGSDNIYMYVLLRILIKNTYIYSYIHSYMLNYSVAALMLYSARTYMQLLTYVHSCTVTLHVCDRMATESIQAALGMNTTQLNLNLP